MEALAKNTFIPMIISAGANSVQMVRTGDLTFCVVTQYDEEAVASAAQRDRDPDRHPEPYDPSREIGHDSSGVVNSTGLLNTMVCATYHFFSNAPTFDCNFMGRINSSAGFLHEATPL